MKSKKFPEFFDLPILYRYMFGCIKRRNTFLPTKRWEETEVQRDSTITLVIMWAPEKKGSKKNWPNKQILTIKPFHCVILLLSFQRNKSSGFIRII
jgi:hypothetical protein